MQSWLQIVTAKQLYFHAVAQHRLGKVAQADKSFGIAVARMSKAVALLQEAEKRGEGAFKGYVSVHVLTLKVYNSIRETKKGCCSRNIFMFCT